MGNLSECIDDGSWNLFHRKSILEKELRKRYHDNYQQTIFYHTCLYTLKHYCRYHPEIKDQSEILQSQSLKRSLLDSCYFQTEKFQSNSEDRLPSRYSTMGEFQKKQKIIQLIRQSYIMLDLSDIFQGQDLQYYDKEIKKEIFKNQQSFMQDSFIISQNTFQSNLCQSLKNFNTETLIQLQNYIQLSNIIKKQAHFQGPQHGQTKQQYISYLLRQLITKLILISRQNQQNLEQIIQNIHTIISIMQETIKLVYRLRIKQTQQYSMMADDSQADIDPLKQSKQQSAIKLDFLNTTNYYTLISSIVMSSKALSQFLVTAIKIQFNKQFKIFKEKSTYSNGDLIRLLKHQKINDYKVHTNIQGLFDHMSTSTSMSTNNNNNKNKKNIMYKVPQNIFARSIKMLNKIPKKMQPILKLKIISEMQKQIIQQFIMLQSLLDMDLLYDRQNSKIICQWLLHREKVNNIENIVAIVITYAFIHREYRISKKGSAIICFVEAVENILGWKIPCE